MIKTNKDDGVDRGFLYDANGNETARIESEATDLRLLSIEQIFALPSDAVQLTQSEYDARDRLVKTYQAAMLIDRAEGTQFQHVWVPALEDPFMQQIR